jgi:hypothetical protein
MAIAAISGSSIGVVTRTSLYKVSLTIEYKWALEHSTVGSSSADRSVRPSVVSGRSLASLLRR